MRLFWSFNRPLTQNELITLLHRPIQFVKYSLMHVQYIYSRSCYCLKKAAESNFEPRKMMQAYNVVLGSKLGLLSAAFFKQ